MGVMFYDASSFNQDLSGWCVKQIPNETQDFALNSALQNDFFPNWGAECANNNPDFNVASNGVTCLCPEADFEDTGTLDINGETKTFTKRSRAQLDVLINDDEQDPQIALTCTSGITDMSSLFFKKYDFNQNISSWDVSNVTTLNSMFYSAYDFNQPIDGWDVGNVTDMEYTFFQAYSFNQPLNSWSVINVSDMTNMFGGTISFNQPLESWDVSQVTNMGFMFYGSSFNQPLNNWDVSQVTKMRYMFYEATSFNQDISMWCVEQIPVEPQGFADNSALQDDFFPNWGAECNLSTTNPDAIGLTILIYPNPSNSKVFIENDGQIILSKIKLIDMLGRDIKTLSASQITHGLDVSGIDAGNYFVQFTTVNDQQFVKRLIVN